MRRHINRKSAKNFCLISVYFDIMYQYFIELIIAQMKQIKEVLNWTKQLYQVVSSVIYKKLLNFSAQIKWVCNYKDIIQETI